MRYLTEAVLKRKCLASCRQQTGGRLSKLVEENNASSPSIPGAAERNTLRSACSELACFLSPRVRYYESYERECQFPSSPQRTH